MSATYPQARSSDRPSLRLFSEDSEPETLRESEECGWITDPASLWTLKRTLARQKSEFPLSRGAESWIQYEILDRKWEKHFGPDFDVTKVTRSDLTQFFEGQEGWCTPRTWEKNLTMLVALFKSICPASITNKFGLPPDLAPWRLDDIPLFETHPRSWFKANRTAGSHRQGGHTPKRRSTLTLEQFQLVVEACWKMPDLRDRVWWETMLAWIWFSGMRIDQARKQLRWCLDGESDGIHLESATIIDTESKCGGGIDVPLPDCLMPGLGTLWQRSKEAKLQEFVFFQRGKMSQETFYITWRRLWEFAIPCSSDQERALKHFHPHQVRAISITNWELRPSPDDKAGWLVTGHSPSDVRLKNYFKPGDSRLKEIVNRFPMPKLRSPKPLFV